MDALDLPEVLTAPELAKFLRTTAAALAQDRYHGRGVPFVKFGSKRVRYLRQDVIDYIAANRMQRTDDPRATA